ncbi:hypothetical protein D3C72_1344320 [compost metagenome]
MQLVAQRGVVQQISAQAQAGDGRLQVVRDGGQDLHALLQVRLDALLHAVEGLGGALHLAWAVLCQSHGGSVGAQCVGCIGQRAQGPRGRAHGPGAQAYQQRQL